MDVNKTLLDGLLLCCFFTTATFHSSVSMELTKTFIFWHAGILKHIEKRKVKMSCRDGDSAARTHVM